MLQLSDAQIANYSKITTTVNQGIIPNNPACVSGQQFDVFNAILASFRNLHVTLQIQSTVALDQYVTPLNFNQFDVAVFVRRAGPRHPADRADRLDPALPHRRRRQADRAEHCRSGDAVVQQRQHHPGHELGLPGRATGPAVEHGAAARARIAADARRDRSTRRSSCRPA